MVADRIADHCRAGGYRVHQASNRSDQRAGVTPSHPTPSTLPEYAYAPPIDPHPIEETDLVIYAGYGREANAEPLTLASSMLPMLEARMSPGAILAVAGAELALRACTQFTKRPTQFVGLTFALLGDAPKEPEVHVSEDTAPGVEVAISHFVHRLGQGAIDAADAAE